ncbi:MAG TPA: hypothetical protein VMT45_06505 [Thermoanaerobaculaceae bacterium]|nr:hypothetical protein [Thermoanaerobaculaceae bacterium]
MVLGELRCGVPELGLVAVAGRVVDLFAPVSTAADRMKILFNVTGTHPSCNCMNFSYEATTEDAKGVYAALVASVNNPRLIVTFCAPGIHGGPHPPLGPTPTPAPSRLRCAAGGFSITPE